MAATVTTPPSTTVQPPTTIKANPTDTAALVASYLTPLLTGLAVTIPSGFKPSGLQFTINADGSSIAFVRWAPIS